MGRKGTEERVCYILRLEDVQPRSDRRASPLRAAFRVGGVAHGRKLGYEPRLISRVPCPLIGCPARVLAAPWTWIICTTTTTVQDI